MRVILIKAGCESEDFITEVEINDDSKLDSLYSLINCETVECPEREIGGVCFDLICDEEGLYRQSYPAAVDLTTGEQIMGNIVLCHTDYETGDWVSVEDGELELVKANVLSAWAGDRFINLVRISL